MSSPGASWLRWPPPAPCCQTPGPRPCRDTLPHPSWQGCAAPEQPAACLALKPPAPASFPGSSCLRRCLRQQGVSAGCFRALNMLCCIAKRCSGPKINLAKRPTESSSLPSQPCYRIALVTMRCRDRGSKAPRNPSCTVGSCRTPPSPPP